MKRLQLLLLLIFGFCLSAVARDYMFKHLEVKDGLSNNKVNTIYKDKNGFIWFGTDLGLNRYDGYKFRVFKSQNDDPKSLPDSYIEEIQGDASGNLWLQTGSGYTIYDLASDTFDSDMETWAGNIGISAKPTLIYIEKEKTFWIYVEGQGLYRYQLGEDKAVFVESVKDIIGNTPVTDMLACYDGTLLVLNDGTFMCVDRDQLMVRWVNKDIAETWMKDKDEQFTLFVDRDDRLWLYSAIGMSMFRLRQKEWVVRSLRTDSHTMIRTIAQDKDGNIWVGRDQGGIELIDRDETRTIIANNPLNERSVSNNTITSLYEDEAGTMWVGTYKKGVSYYNESIFKFSMTSNVGDVNCVEDGGNGIVWLGTNDCGLVRWNSLTDERKVFSHTSDPNSISTDVIVCLLKDSSGKLWIGTFFGGLNCYDGNRFIHYRAGGPEGKSLSNDNVWALAEDDDKNIWIGTLGGGVQCLNPKTGEFTTYSTANSGLINDYVLSMCRGSENDLIVATSSGISMLNFATREITNLTGTKEGDNRFSNLGINQVYEDSRGLLWLATREDLNVYDKNSDELYVVPLKAGHSKHLILGVEEDENKSIWVSTGGELVNVMVSSDPKTGQLDFRCYPYTDKDGLQRCDFNQRSLKRLGTGEIVVGGLYGLNRFIPKEIKYNRTLPKVMFTDFLLFNEEVEVGKEYNGRVVLTKNLNEVDEVVLSYEQNVFAILFATDNFVLPEKTTYSYKLDGFNTDWLTCAFDVHRVTYTNLAPGTYTLHVRATNSDGYASEEDTCLKIVILPPFWRTPLAYVIYAILIIGLIALGFYIMHRRERNRFKIRQIEEDAKKKDELNQMKFRFFTNVSHELRTPLTLIISPLENMMKGMTDEKMLNSLKMMDRNAHRLLNLVNQLLDFRKSEMVGMHLSLSEGDIVQFLRNICTSFVTYSEKKRIHLTFTSLIESLNMQFDEDKVGKIVTNLLSNAFKFTPEDGKVEVAVDLPQESPDKLRIRVSDTGIGIKDEDKERIFDAFYQVEQEDMERQAAGSGIGLSLVRDFVMLHGGSVYVTDNTGGGSVFVVELPIHNEQSTESKSVQIAAPVSVTVQSGGQLHEEILSDDEEDDFEEAETEDEVDEKEKPLALVVDDNEDFITFMKDTLSLYFRIRSASNGKEAWRMIPDLMPDIIVSDVMMGEMDGHELCHWVKMDKRTSDIPVILLTAKRDVEDKVEGLSVGADDYMTKPFNVEVLVLRMRKLVEQHQKKKGTNLINPEPSEIAITSLDEKLVERAIKYVEANIDRSDLSVEELSRELGMSRVHLYKKLTQITGKPPVEFIRVIRLKRAAQLLRESQLNVSEIAFQVGFNNPKYFSKYFKEEFGVSPSVYQEKEGK